MRGFTVTVRAGTRDYDADNDGLIEVRTLAQLDAVRYDLDGDGLVDGATWMPYYAAFAMGALGMGCPDGCTGYELEADLDFDTDGDGTVDSDDDYWNDGDGWEPIGGEEAPYAATFNGNGRTVANLLINRPTEDEIGLFGEADRILIEDIGVVGADVTGQDGAGALLGRGIYVAVINSHATGEVTGRNEVGGLVGAIVRPGGGQLRCCPGVRHGRGRRPGRTSVPEPDRLQLCHRKCVGDECGRRPGGGCEQL